MKKTPIIHPFLFSLYIVLFNYFRKIEIIPITMILRSAIMIFAVTVIIYWILVKWTKNPAYSGVLTTLFVFYVYYFGFVQILLEKSLNIMIPGWLRLLVFGIVTSAIILAVFLVARNKNKLRPLTIFLNFSATILILMPVMLLLINQQSVRKILFSTQIDQAIIDPGKDSALANISPSTPPNTARPDIYYIILDGYGRSDVLNETFGIDNSDFIQALQARGFYVADQSHSNYLATYASLASSLNYEYLDAFPFAEKESTNRLPLASLIKHSRVRSFFESLGYQFIAFDTGFLFTQVQDADVYLSNFPGINVFEEVLLDSSILSLFKDSERNIFPIPSYATHRKRMSFLLEQLKKVPSAYPSPKFVFAHIMLPHPPFIFDEQGGAAQIYAPFTLFDGENFPGTLADYRNGYSDQLKFINRTTIGILDEIINTSGSNSIIIIQGDHGSRVLLNTTSLERSCIREASSILYAIYLPSKDYSGFTRDISPVNTFRLILDKAFGKDLTTLENKVYYSTNKKPYSFTDVTQLTSDPCHIQ